MPRTRTTASGKSVRKAPKRSARHPAFDRDNQFQERRLALLHSAIHLFNRLGYHATSMEAIAEEVGLTKGTLYYYYDSKSTLAYDCLLESIADGMRTAKTAQEGGGSGLERLERYLRLQFETLAGRGGSSWPHMDMSMVTERQRGEIRKRSREVDALVQTFIAEGIADGSIVDLDPKLAEFFVMGALNWVPRWFKPEGPKGSSELASLFIRLTFDGLRAR